MTNLASEILDAAKTSFVNQFLESKESLRPKLLYNDINNGNTVLASIESELLDCKSFWFSVAFITKSGLIVLKEALKTLEMRGIKGKILTTDYLAFNEPDALRELMKFSNLEVRIFTQEHFHTKGYMFQKEDHNVFIVGSSNVTQTALKSNKEWNLKISSLEQGELISESEKEFHHMWGKALPLTEEWISMVYEPLYISKKKERTTQIVERIRTYSLEPNKMQKAAVKSLSKLREDGKNKALLISATGTGKTYLSAFDVRNVKPNKMLFLVHREQILKQAMDSFKDVLGNNINTGLLSGTHHDFDADYLFSTVQTMSKDAVLSRYGEDYFDYVIIDETHKAGAESYRKIINYFKPKFLLGMTASPERTDGFDIFQLFDHNIAYEIRLQQALEEDLLCPFHYFGVTELTVDGALIDDNTEFRYLVSEERVNHIIEKAEFYGHCGDRVKGLIFCGTIKEAEELSALFNKKGYQTAALSGANTQEERESRIEQLEQVSRDGGLDYIFTVDIFNEGVDIPEVNQIIMLRPTQSSIIFVQQLGRGLRKAPDKEYLVVIDFIGNYQKNFLIPIALSGDRSYNKDTIRRYIAEGNRVIPGCSTIHFDEITKKQLYASIDAANFSDVRLIRDNYTQLKYKIGRIPKMQDFDTYGEMDIMRIIDNKSLGSYYKFLEKYEEEYTIRLNEKEQKFVEYISKKFASGKRIHELLVLKRLLSYRTGVFSFLKEKLEKEYQVEYTKATENNVKNIMTNEFASGTGKKTYEECVFIKPDEGDYAISDDFASLLRHKEFYNIVNEIVEFGISRYNANYSNRYMNTNFQLYQKYTYDDVCRLLEWEKGEVALNIGGYKFDRKTKTYPVFINYDKEDHIQDSIRYEDRFLDPSTLIAISKSGRSTESEDVYTALNAEKLGVDMELFVRKNKDDKVSKEFYYLGKIKATGEVHEFVMNNTNKKAVEIQYKLVTPVRDDLYEYIVN